MEYEETVVVGAGQAGLGSSTVVPGLFFIGVHFLRKRKSALLAGVGGDAGIVAGQVADRRRRKAG